MDELENQIDSIIKKIPNFSKLNYEIKIITQKPVNASPFPDIDSSFEKIDIVCSKVKLNSFTKVNTEIQEMCNQIQKLNSTYFVQFIFDECDIKFWNENINIDCHVIFHNSNINVNVQDVKINEVYLLSKNFYNCNFKNLSLLTDVNIVHVDLFGNSIDLFQLVKINITDNQINKIDIKGCKIEKITVKESSFSRDFTIYNSTINEIRIENVNFNSLSEFNEVTFQNIFDFREITYKGFTLFDKCIFNTKAKFEYIIFEKSTSFRELIFNKGLNLDFTSCDNEINFFGIKGLNQKESKENTSQETYRILKHNFEKIGNKIDSNEYLTLELDKHRNNIWNSSEFSFRLLRDGIVSFLHWISSNHSSNWFLTLVWIFIVSIVTNVYFDNNLGIECLFKYINILSSIEDFNNSYFIMILNKVSLGYLYYQFLTAIRKDTRK